MKAIKQRIAEIEKIIWGGGLSCADFSRYMREFHVLCWKLESTSFVRRPKMSLIEHYNPF